MLNRKPYSSKHPTLVSISLQDCTINDCLLDPCYKLLELKILNCKGSLLVRNFNIKHLYLENDADFDVVNFYNSRPNLVYI